MLPPSGVKKVLFQSSMKDLDFNIFLLDHQFNPTDLFSLFKSVKALVEFKNLNLVFRSFLSLTLCEILTHLVRILHQNSPQIIQMQRDSTPFRISFIFQI